MSAPDEQARNLAMDAFHIAIRCIQDAAGIETGDYAAQFFSGPNGDDILATFAEYARDELENAKGERI